VSRSLASRVVREAKGNPDNTSRFLAYSTAKRRVCVSSSVLNGPRNETMRVRTRHLLPISYRHIKRRCQRIHDLAGKGAPAING